MNVVGLSKHPETEEYLMIMQFADMGTLESRPCELDGNWYTALAYATKITSRLTSLHEMGFCHKDLHAGNIVFHKFHTALLIDVGLSRGVEEAHSEEGVYGRTEYLPPEIFENKEYTQKSDIYCLGTLLWQLIVGVPPQGVASVAVKRNPNSLRDELISGAPTTFNDIIRSCWRLDPDQRPSAHEVYNQLIECAAGLAEISPVMQPISESGVLSALAMEPVPFSLEIQSFINTRRTIHQKKLEAGDSSDVFDFSTSSTSINHTRSQFHTHENLKKITEQYSSLVTLGQQSSSCMYIATLRTWFTRLTTHMR